MICKFGVALRQSHLHALLDDGISLPLGAVPENAIFFQTTPPGDQPPADDSCLRVFYPESGQLKFGRQVIEDFGYDFDRGRQDKTPHPFMIKFSLGDVRITTRVNENYIDEALFSSLHEAGHALYELGIDAEYEGTPLARGTSSGVHESQSRLWENQVGRSRAGEA